MTSNDGRVASVILTVAPRVEDKTYRDHFDALIAFLGSLIAAAHPDDTVLTIVDSATRAAIGDRLPGDRLLEGELDDIWIRDFGPVPAAGELVQFVYRPVYHPLSFSNQVVASWAHWLAGAGIVTRPVELILDGGNLVYNRVGDAVVTERVLRDNPGRTREEIRVQLVDEAGLRRVAIVPEGPREKTGHADGLVSWLAPKVIGIGRVDEPFRSRIGQSLAEQLPDVTLVDVPHAPTGELWHGWESCSGIYANSLVTRHAHYVPQFGLGKDEPALTVYRQQADRPVIPVETGPEVRLGGTIRCLTVEIEGAVAERLLALRDGSRDEEQTRS
jgi:agmatine/peptidylarginine deiminase